MRRTSRSGIATGLSFVVACLATLVIVAIVDSLPAVAEPDLANGKTMFFAGGCASCHAAPASSDCENPKTAERLNLVGGRCLKTPFGTFYVPNISPDKETGIGGWTTPQFIKAMREGVSPSGEHYYPAFPYTSYQRMAEKDLVDLKAFLDTLPAIRSDVRDHDLSFPFNIRVPLVGWKFMFLDGKQFKPDPAKSDLLNRGAYLVEGPGHCGECHSPRNMLGGIISDKRFSGAKDPEGKGVVPNITPHSTGIENWSEADIVTALETGLTPSFDTFGGNMVKVQENMAELSSQDRKAIAAYLKSLPALPSSVGTKAEQK